jgi:putative flippase GtrA
MFIAPASAVITGAASLGERLEALTLAGIVLSILAVYMLNRIWIFKTRS